jgi:hypothetical protein
MVEEWNFSQDHLLVDLVQVLESLSKKVIR